VEFILSRLQLVGFTCQKLDQNIFERGLGTPSFVGKPEKVFITHLLHYLVYCMNCYYLYEVTREPLPIREPSRAFSIRLNEVDIFPAVLAP